MEDKEKKYKTKEIDPCLVSEAAVSYQVDLNAMKLRMMEDMMHIDNPEKLRKLEGFLYELSMLPEKPPCQYTLEELREQVLQSEREFESGNYYDAEEVLKDWDKWLD